MLNQIKDSLKSGYVNNISRRESRDENLIYLEGGDFDFMGISNLCGVGKYQDNNLKLFVAYLLHIYEISF